MGLIHVVICVVAAGVVAYPLIAVHVRDVGMASLVTVVAIRLSWLGRGNMGRRRPTRRCGLMLPAATATLMVLGKRWDSKNKQSSKSYLNGLHDFLRTPSG
jgi:hypothetical protein